MCVDGQRTNIWKVTQSKYIALFPQSLLVKFQKFDIIQQQHFSAARLGLCNLSAYFTWNMLCLVTQSCLTLCDTVNCRCHRLLCPRGCSRQEYWSGLPYPPPGDLSNSGIDPRSCTQQTDSLLSEPPGKPCMWHTKQKNTCSLQRCIWENVLGAIICVHVCLSLLKMIYEENFPHYLPAEDPESVIPFISPCKTDHFFSQTVSFVIQNQGRCHAVLTVFP